ncbi:hypothetical protein AZE42_09042 [Rhizopogon vesiculosus]|uniref:Uncharacterized protein n=1 Tax=Rhizopogon vesiculosus TaxID=180088 RepID=A0A1J8QBN3_9AGAM|nr:hypothetical protein AZE42_09042 [Rhizopogon vesiculosus]
MPPRWPLIHDRRFLVLCFHSKWSYWLFFSELNATTIYNMERVALRPYISVMFEFNVMHVDDSCGFMIIDHMQMTSLFIYTMCYDILALALTIIGLRNTRSSNVIWRTLRIQGISYVVVTCLANIVPAIMSSLNLNTVMNVAFAIPVHSTIASSRIVLSFLDSQPSSVEAEEMSSRDVPLTTVLTLPTSSTNVGQSSGWGTDI